MTSLIFAAVACGLNRNTSLKLKIAMYVRFILTALICLEIFDGRQFLSWIILGSTPFFLWSYSTNVKDRIEGIVLSTICPFALLSASYECLFYLVFAAHLLSWPLPKTLDDKLESLGTKLKLQDFVRASFLVMNNF